jgi:hypothetical protein
MKKIVKLWLKPKKWVSFLFPEKKIGSIFLFVGYCYFNRPAEPEINKSYATKTQPIRVETTNPSSSLNANSESTNDKSTSACSLSSWNNKGTTYEEKGRQCCTKSTTSYGNVDIAQIVQPGCVKHYEIIYKGCVCLIKKS